MALERKIKYAIIALVLGSLVGLLNAISNDCANPSSNFVSSSRLLIGTLSAIFVIGPSGIFGGTCKILPLTVASGISYAILGYSTSYLLEISKNKNHYYKWLIVPIPIAIFILISIYFALAGVYSGLG